MCSYGSQVGGLRKCTGSESELTAGIKLPSVTSHQQDFLLRLCRGWWLFNNSVIVSVIVQFNLDLLWKMNQDFVTGRHTERACLMGWNFSAELF